MNSNENGHVGLFGFALDLRRLLDDRGALVGKLQATQSPAILITIYVYA